MVGCIFPGNMYAGVADGVVYSAGVYTCGVFIPWFVPQYSAQSGCKSSEVKFLEVWCISLFCTVFGKGWQQRVDRADNRSIVR